MKDNLLSTIRSMQWQDQDKIIPPEEAHIAKSWGLDRSQMEGLHSRERIYTPSSPSSWSPLPPQVFKLNFDGASKGNLGPAGYGGICQDHSGRIISI